MSEATGGALSDYIRRLAGTEADEVADGALLRRFSADGDGAAFAAWLRRHGPMVLGVCRRALGDGHLAEDAFQATFLALARQAARLARSPSVGGWLHVVAGRVARRARAGLRRQAAAE